MTIPEATQLVIQAGALGISGEVFVLNMGEPIKVMDLARQMIRLYGYIPEEDIQFKYIGIRPGEKIFEELLSEKEKSRVLGKSGHEKIFIAQTEEIDEENIEALFKNGVLTIHLPKMEDSTQKKKISIKKNK